MNILLRDYSDFQQVKLTKNPEGYYNGLIRVTCTGVFTYMDENGVVRRLRPMDQVSALESIKSINNKPVTLLHPSEDVTPENSGKYMVGMSANDAFIDSNQDVWVSITITRKDAIEAIDSGDVEAISMGYSCVIVHDSGNWHGVEYDEVMTEIRYNHIALVKRGRAGDSVRFRVGDSADFDKIFNKIKPAHSAKESNMKQIMIDSVACQADEKVIDAYLASKKNLETANATIVAKDKALQELQGAKDAVDAELKKLKDSSLTDEQIAKKVADQVALISKAKDMGVEVKDGASALDIKKAVIKKAFGDEFKLDEATEGYVEGAFSTACQSLSRKNENGLKDDLGGFKGDPDDVNKAFDEMMTNFNNSKKEG